MPGNPNIGQGTINRLRASAIFPAFGSLSVTAPYLGRGGISLSFQGTSTVLIDAMTGIVTSPEPYLQFNCTMHLLKSQAFADLWKKQQEQNTLLGDMTIRPDSPTLSPYLVNTASIIGIDGLDFSGGSAEFTVHIGGSYFINSDLWP